MSPKLPPERIERLTGYGQHGGGDAYVYRPTSVQGVRDVMDSARAAGRKVVLRGAGRSYGDANFCPEAVAIDITRMNRVLSWDPEAGVLDAEAGVTIEQIWRYTIEDGYWPAVVSGTAYPTLAGALAMNIHGKNHFRAGSFAEHVVDVDLLAPNGEMLTLRPGDELFNAVISSAGLLGVITRVKLRLHRVVSGELRVLPVSVPSWDAQFAAFEEMEATADYLVGWVDLFGKGRGLVHAAWYGPSDPGSLKLSRQELSDSVFGFFPKSAMWRVLRKFNNRTGMRLINWAKYQASKLHHRKQHFETLAAFSFLLDSVPNWRKAYEPGGFLQYQAFVPKQFARDVFAQLGVIQRAEKLESFLGVLKRHRPDPFLLTWALDGYSLALDFKVTSKNRERLWAMCHRMNAVVLQAGGRFYFAKDSTLRPQDVRAYLGEEVLAHFREIKSKLDPDGLLTTAQAERLKLCEQLPATGVSLESDLL